MKKRLIVYFSKTGNSKFIAEKLANLLDADLREARASMQSIGWMFLFSALGWKIRTNLKPEDLKEYDELLVIGPIWGGSLISPLKDILMKCRKSGKPTHFAVTCETPEKDREGKYGYDQVLSKGRKLLESQAGQTAAFSASLVADPDTPQSLDPDKKVHFSDENYRGLITDRVLEFVRSIKESEKAVMA